MDWNPHAPDVLGPEWAPRSAPTLPTRRIAAPIDAAAMRLDSTVTETVNSMGVFVNSDTAAGRVLAEVLVAGSEVPTDMATAIYRPNASTPGNWVATGAASAHAALAQVSLDLAVYAAQASDGAALQQLTLQFDTAGVLTGRRIVAVRLVLVGARTATTNARDINLVVNIEGGTTVLAQPEPFNAAPYTIPLRQVVDLGEIHPNTGQPWTLAQLQAMDTSTADLIIAVTSNTFGVKTRIYQVWIEVDHCAENRLSRNVITTGNTGARWATFTPAKVDDSANLAKVSGTDMTLVIRQPRYGQVKPTTIPADYLFSVPYIEGLNDTPVVGLFEYERIALGIDGTVSVLADPSEDRVIGWHLSVAGTQSVDAQPYVAVPEITVAGTVEQEVSQASAQAYDGVTFPAKYVGVGGVAGNLVVALKRRSDNATMGTATITQALADSFDPDPINGYRLITAPFAAPATLAAGVQYYLTFSEAGTGSWIIPSLSAVPVLGSAVTGVGSYRGTTDIATYGGGDVSAADLPVLVYAEPDTPTAFTATPDAVAAGDEVIGLTGIPFVLLEWTVPSVSNFSHYEIQRRDEFDTDWVTIKEVDTSSIDEFTDLEPVRGFESEYRIRTVNVMGIGSPWSATAAATTETGGPGYTFTSNHAPDDSLGYADISEDPVRPYSFPEASEDSPREFYGRNNVVMFRPDERRGPAFDRTLLASSGVRPARPGPDVFQPLRDLAKMDLPYVCVRDEDGNRWYASISVPDAVTMDPDGDHFVTVRITKVADAPTAA